MRSGELEPVRMRFSPYKVTTYYEHDKQNHEKVADLLLLFGRKDFLRARMRVSSWGMKRPADMFSGQEWRKVVTDVRRMFCRKFSENSVFLWAKNASKQAGVWFGGEF